MSVDMTLVRSAQGGGASKSVSTVVTGDSAVRVQTLVASDATDALLTIGLDVDNIKALFIVSDQDLTIKTNSTGAPDNTIVLIADEPLVWNKFASGSEYYTNLFATDVTKMYLTNDSDPAVAANLTIIVVQDATV